MQGDGDANFSGHLGKRARNQRGNVFAKQLLYDYNHLVHAIVDGDE